MQQSTTPRTPGRLQSNLAKAKSSNTDSSNQRKLSLTAYTAYLKEGHFLPSEAHLAYGACKMARALDFIAISASLKGKLSLKAKEKALLRLALFELYYLNDTPRFAVGMSWVQLAKETCHPTFVKFLNFLLRNLPENLPVFPEYAVEYSYPDSLIDILYKDYSSPVVNEILRLGNLPGVTYARVRPTSNVIEVKQEELQELVKSKDHYVQNKTQVELIFKLASLIKAPGSILDLCAAPGGKLLALADAFPQAKLSANDLNEKKLHRLRENCEKYSLKVDLHTGLGELYPLDHKFDLIVIDAPCSGTGVFRKHPEARWQEDRWLKPDLKILQTNLIERAKDLLNPGGSIFYLSCSVLKSEQISAFKPTFEEQILPDDSGRDGGYGALLTF